MFLVGSFERSSCEARAYSNVWSMGLSLEQALYRGDGVQSLPGDKSMSIPGGLSALCGLQMGGQILDERGS